MIGILTYHFAHNYGAMLQAYALKIFMSKYEETEIINYCPFLMECQYSISFKDVVPYKLLIKLYDRFIRKKQYEKFEEFKRSWLMCNQKITKEQLGVYTKKYDTLIVGSDQVWNTNINFNDTSYFLDFSSENQKTIGYSVSIGKSEITDELARNLGKYLEKFNRVSFREESAKRIVNELCCVNTYSTVDPVFFMDRKAWSKIENPITNLKNKEFILYYSLSEDRLLEKKTKELARKHKLPIISIHPLCIKNSIADYNLTSVGPREFLWLIDNAKFISSNSFHATAFSIIFRKKAILSAHKTIGDRNKDLLNLVHSESYLKDGIYNFNEINCETLNNAINKSKEFTNPDNRYDIGKIKYPEYPKVFAARSKNKTLVIKSSSGGIFSLLCSYFLSNGGIVAAAKYNYENDSVEHHLIRTIDEYEEYRGSKYLQSNPGDIYSKCITELKKDNRLMFVGTACQTSALIKLCELNRLDISNLYLCDILCHGVPSPKIWKYYLGTIKKRINNPITYISFRDKRKGWANPTIVAKTKDREYSLQSYADLFYCDAFLRPSCYECNYASVNRPSDITIGDFWGIDSTHPDFYDKDGTSLILVQSAKGNELFNNIIHDMDYIKSNTLLCIQNNLLRPTKRPYYRKLFWSEFTKKGVRYVQKKYFPRSILGKAIRKIRRKIKGAEI